MRNEQEISCSFCGAPNAGALWFVAAPENNAFICENCIEASRDIIGHERQTNKIRAIEKPIDTSEES